MKRKPRRGEVVCRCGAYKFPHRQFGGWCDGMIIVGQVFDSYHRSCRDCHLLDTSEGRECEVLQGREPATMCPEVQEYIQFNEIRLCKRK